MKIYCYSHPHFSFEIFSSNLESRQHRYTQTLQKRNEEIRLCNVQINTQNQTLEKTSSLTLKTLCTLKHFQYHWDSFLTQNYSLSRPQLAWICKRSETKLQNNFTLTSE